MTQLAFAPFLVVSRIAAAVLGGYVFVWGFATFLTALLLAAGVRYDDALTSANLLAFLLFLGTFLWAFSVRSLVRAWAVLAGGGALMTLAGWLLAR